MHLIYKIYRHSNLSKLCLLILLMGGGMFFHKYSTAHTTVLNVYTHPVSIFNEDTLPKSKGKLIIGTVDSTRLAADTTLRDSMLITTTDTLSNGMDTVDIPEEDGEIKDIITYHALDSIVYDMDSKKMFLYDSAHITYQQIKLDANSVEFDWTTYTLMAEGTDKDSNGVIEGKPVFEESGKGYNASKLKYNFKTKKGIVYEVVTVEGDARIISNMVKKNETDEWYGQSNKYTTCDLDHPHFYFKSKKVKIVPNKVLVTGPANLWVGDVPTPLVLPFGMFPVKQGRKSGLVLPEYGQDAVYGFFLRNGGYYWAVNDYMSLKFLGQVGTNGTWGVGVASQYAWRYKFTGNLAFSYMRTRPSDPDLPGVKASNSYSVSWTHTQDPKSIPNSTFGANVQIQSADYYNASRITDQRSLNTSFNSGVNFSRVFPKTPLSLSVNLRHTQNLLNRTISFTLPQVRLSMSRIAPFKSKIQTGKPKWYESIGFTYSLEFQNQINTYDSTLFQQSTLDQFRFGFNQQLNIDAPITLFKYLNVNPAFSYQERTYFRGIEQSWNPDTSYVIRSDGKVDTLNGRIVTDTVWRFNSARNFNASLSLSTKMIGIFRFKGKLKAIKHVFTPTVSFVYSPDFSLNPFKYYNTVQSSATGETTRYSVFEPNSVYGSPGPGAQGTVQFGLANNLEMKVFSKKDTINNEKKVGLLDQVNFTGGYNFFADSLRLQPFNLSVVSSRIFNLINLNFNAVFDPYATDTMNRKINTFQYSQNKRLLRFASANISATTSLHSKPRPAPSSAMAQEVPNFVGDYVSYNPNQFYDFDIPWNINLSYRFNITRGTTFNPDTIITVQTISASADFNLTPKWKVAVSSGFDITRKQVTLTNVSVIRDLHCWELSFTWTPPINSSYQQQFTILLHPKSTTLQDLKIQRRNAGGGAAGVPQF